MTYLIKLEELAQFILAIWLFAQMDFAWWVFPACILLPDVSMVGYAVNTKVGAWVYNLFHHKTLAITILIVGFSISNDILLLAGIILFAHSAMDRILGYGLKYPDSFKHTHLEQMG
ncbi:hypothetical protein EL17_01240 [Anditalea andensis]|uniref:DUF4260 domain-containing protein n=2 Tax=Anditalea andensis TaxID=1048983 RepID=A0A074KZS9_9BACT|nr:hypothetical protein EL17_01240 [Anditalea andensis]